MRPALLVLLLASAPALAQGGAGPRSGNPSFNLVNRASQAIQEIYATPAGVDRWGQDRLARNLVPAGGTFPVRLPARSSCIYDLRVVYADGKAEERRRVDTCGINEVAFPGGRTAGTPGQAGPNSPPANNSTDRAGDPSFRLVNRRRSEVNEVYASPTGEDDWGQDRLGDDTVGIGSTRVIRLPRGDCRYDVRVVFADGEAIERRRLNLCDVTELRVP